MAPTQQQNMTASSLSSCTEDSLHKKSSSKVQSSSKSSSVCNSSRSSISSDSSRASLEGRTSTMEWPHMEDSLIPIATRGLFYNDSFFENARNQFDQAVKEVVGQWGQRSDQVSDLDSYRQIREADLKDSNQAVSLSQDDVCHKVVLDVKDFLEGDVKVKVLDENELLIEGSAEKKEGNSISKRSFNRRFTFPGLVKADAVSSAVSSDGVLTVNVPKNNQRETTTTKTNFQLQNGKEDASTTNTTSSSFSTNFSSNLSSTGMNDKLASEKNREAFATEDFLHNRSDILLPISEKGSFFHDSFFENARQDFEKSIKEVLNKSGMANVSDTGDNLTSYRNLREKDLKQENQAVSLTEDDNFHKVVLDVKDFMKGNINVKVVDENEIKIEGDIEEKNEGKSSQKSFNRSFTFPGPIKSNDITSAMSSDGVLTVKVPKDKDQKAVHSTNSSSSLSSNIHSNLQNMNFTNQDRNESFQERVLKNSDMPSHLPVFEKGHFFHDDFFASFRHDFEKAVQEVLEKQGQSSSLTQDMTSYRTLREKDLKEENQAVSVSEDHQSHKVVMDVQHFDKDDLKVKIVNENELVVEGKVEKKVGDSTSTRSFCRKFVFPGLVNDEAVSSSMSSDGVLIITIPKKQQEHKMSMAHQSQDKENKLSTNASHASKHMSSSHSLKQESNTQSVFANNDQNHLMQGHDMTEDLDMASIPFPRVMSSFHDDFFAKAHKEFEEATNKAFNYSQDMMLSAGEESFFKDRQDDEQKFSILEDDRFLKVKIDVSDFVGGDLQVKALEQNELLVEGRKEVLDHEGRTSNRSFSRRVNLPGAVRVNDITSVLSKDGVLVVTAPKEC